MTSPHTPRRRLWPNDMKVEVLATAAVDGHAIASSRHGVPLATVKRWTRTEAMTARSAIERVAPGSMPPLRPGESWGDRIPWLLDGCAWAAEEALEAMRDGIEDRVSRDAQSFAICFGVCVDKALRLAEVRNLAERMPNPTANAYRPMAELAVELERLSGVIEERIARARNENGDRSDDEDAGEDEGEEDGPEELAVVELVAQPKESPMERTMRLDRARIAALGYDPTDDGWGR